MTTPRRDSWTILEILRWTTDYFRQKEVAEPRASGEVLLAHTLNLSRLDLYLRYDQPLTPAELARFKALVVRRVKGEPPAYLTGHKEFWSLDFQVAPGVLIPRPETETLMAAALEVVREERGKEVFEGRAGGKQFPVSGRRPLAPSPWGLEVGVGSGAVVTALARELPQMTWLALDLSRAALLMARENARRHEVAHRIRFLKTDLLSGLKPRGRFALLVANLPYVPRAQWEELPRDIKDYEPREALVAGEDGLAFIRPLARQAHHYLRPGGWLALEVGEGQAQEVMGFLQDTGAYERLGTVNDYHGIPRVVRGERSR
jgi:release factor glutamine methyltransferase